MASDMIARALAIKANKTMPAVSSADAGKLATVDSNGKWAAANLAVGQGEVAVDNTLLVSGAAADAKVTGDKVNELKSALKTFTGNEKIDITRTGYIDLTGTTADVNSPVVLSGYYHQVVTCTGGDIFTISGRVPSTLKVYGFVSATGTVLDVSPSSNIGSNYRTIAPENSAYFVVNMRPATATVTAIMGDILVGRVNVLEADTSKINEVMRYPIVTTWTDGFIDDNGNVASDSSSAKSVYSEKLPRVKAILFHQTMNTAHNSWVRFSTYNTDNEFLENHTVTQNLSDVILNYTFPTNAEYCIVSYTTYNDTASLVIEYVPNTDLLNKVVSSDVIIGSDAEDCIGTDCILLRKNLPTYYTEQPANPTSYNDDCYIDEKVNSVEQGKHFVFFTDTHWDGGTSDTGAPFTGSNAKLSPMLIEYVRKRLQIRNVIFGGDYINVRDNKYLAKQVLTDFANNCFSAFGYMMPVMGNHDINLANQVGSGTEADKYLPFSVVQKTLFNHLPKGAVTELEYVQGKVNALSITQTQKSEIEAFFKLTYHYDDNIDKIRYIVLNSGNPDYGEVYDVFGNDDFRLHLDWYYHVLNTTPEGYDVCIAIHMMHAPNTFDVTVGNNTKMYVQLAMGLKTKSNKKTYIGEVSNETLTAWYPYTTRYYDFTSAHTVGKVFFVIGHAHQDGISIASQSTDSYNAIAISNYTGATLNQTVVTPNDGCEIPLIYVTTDAYAKYAKYDNSSQYDSPMQKDTITEHAFDVFTLQHNAIKMTRFGAYNVTGDDGSMGNRTVNIIS